MINFFLDIRGQFMRFLKLNLFISFLNTLFAELMVGQSVAFVTIWILKEISAANKFLFRQILCFLRSVSMKLSFNFT